jgi:hypothetical protein
VPAAEVSDDHWLMEERRCVGEKEEKGRRELYPSTPKQWSMGGTHLHDANTRRIRVNGSSYYSVASNGDERDVARTHEDTRMGERSGTSRCRVRSVRADMSHGWGGGEL